MDWDDFKFNNIKSVTFKSYQQKILRFNEFLSPNKDDKFYYHIINHKDGIKTVIKFFDCFETPPSPETIKGYLHAIGLYLEQIPDFNSTCYAQIQQFKENMYKKAREQQKNIRTDNHIDWNKILPKLNIIINAKLAHLGVRIYCLLMKYNIGCLRPSDIINTRLDVDNGIHHFLDVNNKIWKFYSQSTKNNQDRIILLSNDFIKKLDLIRPNDGVSPWLIYTKRYKTQYPSTVEFVNAIKKYIGYSHNQIRHSFTTYIHSSNNSIDTTKMVANNMGHSYLTAVNTYTHFERKND